MNPIMGFQSEGCFFGLNSVISGILFNKKKKKKKKKQHLLTGWGWGEHSSLQCVHMRDHRNTQNKELLLLFLRMNANRIFFFFLE